MTKKIRHLFVMFAILLWPATSFACCVCDDVIDPVSDAQWNSPPWNYGSTHVINTHIDNEFNAHETWLVKFMMEDNILPAMMLMAEQLTATAIQQVGIIGMFFDAEQQLETQRTIQTMQAEIYKDYQPSIGLCEFGSGMKSLAATERKADYNAVIMAQRALDRHLGSSYSAGFGGEQYDKENRLNQFINKFCDPKDNNGYAGSICLRLGSNYNGGNYTDKDRERFNKDVDFSRMLGTPWTLEIDYGDIELTQDEEDVFALQNNIFGHKVFTRIPPKILTTSFGDRVGLAPGEEAPYTTESARVAYMDMRALMAKRGVAENSFNQMVAEKAEGTGTSTKYLKEMMKELGVGVEYATDADGRVTVQPGNDQDLIDLLGENPSYYAQMEMLTKKIYQNPDFYTNLYDKPANISRKEAAIQALELIQKFDMFKSNLRTEANLSLLLETAVMDLQAKTENEFSEVPVWVGDDPATQLQDQGLEGLPVAE